MTSEELLELLEPPAYTMPEAPRLPVSRLVEELKEADQDHEFYPTTDEIIRALVRDLGQFGGESALDIGAGNGKVLLALKERAGIKELMAIEKSSILCRELPEEVLVVGTKFEEQSLLSKHVDVIFCNPPYSQFEVWSEKIIREAASRVVYLVIPERWKNSVRIKDAIQFREARFYSVGSFSFEDAEDRQARAKVNLLRIELSEGDDAFERFFEEQFADLIKKYKGKKKDEAEEEEDESEPEQAGRFGSLVVGPNYPEALVALYRQEMAHVEHNYKLVNELDGALLKEFGMSPKSIMECLKKRITGLRNIYWHELFSHLNTVTDRLTSTSRKKLLETLHKHVQVDFTVANILEVVIWVIKNANRYIDKQLIETYEMMVAKCNVHLYKSNHRVWVEERWRCADEPAKNSHYSLDYRIVTHRIGGIDVRWDWDKGLSERAAEFLGDLLTIARNLGFKPCDSEREYLHRNQKNEWRSGKQFVFHFTNKAGQKEQLFDVRAFKNSNLHLRLNKAFILALNVEHGRLKGWIRSPKEAVEELQDNNAAQYFHGNIQIGSDNPALLLCQTNS
jgi:predicted RNA methylase